MLAKISIAFLNHLDPRQIFKAFQINWNKSRNQVSHQIHIEPNLLKCAIVISPSSRDPTLWKEKPRRGNYRKCISLKRSDDASIPTHMEFLPSA